MDGVGEGTSVYVGKDPARILTTYVEHAARRDENSDVRPGWTKTKKTIEKAQKLQGDVHIMLK